MCAAGSGGGTRFARLPPVIEIIPRSGYNTHATCLKGLKSLKGILAARLQPVIEVIHRSGYLIHAARQKGLKRLKGILAPGVSGYRLAYHRLSRLYP